MFVHSFGVMEYKFLSFTPLASNKSWLLFILSLLTLYIEPTNTNMNNLNLLTTPLPLMKNTHNSFSDPRLLSLVEKRSIAPVKNPLNAP